MNGVVASTVRLGIHFSVFSFPDGTFLAPDGTREKYKGFSSAILHHLGGKTKSQTGFVKACDLTCLCSEESASRDLDGSCRKDVPLKKIKARKKHSTVTAVQ